MNARKEVKEAVDNYKRLLGIKKIIILLNPFFSGNG
jgi:hypothetical protein